MTSLSSYDDRADTNYDDTCLFYHFSHNEKYSIFTDLSSLTLYMLSYFHVLTFFIFFFQKFLSLSMCQTVWIQIRTDFVSVLIWVQTVCKEYKQTTKVVTSKERDNAFLPYVKVPSTKNSALQLQITHLVWSKQTPHPIFFTSIDFRSKQCKKLI